MASLKSRCFLFIFIILVFRLVRKLVFLYLNVMYLKEIPCLNKVTLPLPLPMKRLGVLLLPPPSPPGWDASPSQGYPQHYVAGIRKNITELVREYFAHFRYQPSHFVHTVFIDAGILISGT